MSKHHYIEIIRYADKEVVKRLDVSDRSERSRGVIDSGMNRNLNHEEYYTLEKESDTELKVFG